MTKTLSEDAFNGIEKILAVSKMNDVFDIVQDDDGTDRFYDFEEGTTAPLSEGLGWVADGCSAEAFDTLSDNEKNAVINVMSEYGFKLDLF